MGLTKIGTDGVKDDAVTTDKLANAINTERTANTAKVSTTINNNADNRVITGSGTANTLEGESSLTYDGSDLNISNDVPQLILTDTNSNNSYGRVRGNGGNLILSADHGGATAGSAILAEIDGGEKLRIDSDGNTHFGSSGTLNDSNVVSVVPSDGRISFGMDGRSSFVTGESGAYIYSGDGVSGTTVAGDLIIQSRSNQDRTIRFVTGSSPAQRLSITNNGLLFGTDTAAANALDDYEEGTWTVSLLSGGSSITNQPANNRYVKIGSMVYITGEIVSLVSPNSDILEIGGLPYAIAQGREGTGSCMSHYVTYGTNRTMLTTYLYDGNSKFRFYSSGNATSWRAITGDDFSTSGDIIFSFAYHTA